MRTTWGRDPSLFEAKDIRDAEEEVPGENGAVKEREKHGGHFMKNELQKVANGGRWDLQLDVRALKVIKLKLTSEVTGEPT